MEQGCSVSAQPFPGRTWAVTTYVGSFQNLSYAYAEIGARVANRADVQFDDGPVLEVYHTNVIDEYEPVQYLEVFLPVVVETDKT